MKTLATSELEIVQGGGFCTNAGAFLGGVGVGTAGLTYFGIVTVATGGTVGLIAAVAGAGLAIYCA